MEGRPVSGRLSVRVVDNANRLTSVNGPGSTMAVVNASGVVRDSYTYDVYGTPTKTGSLANEFDFAGQQTDGTGPISNRAGGP